MNPAKLIAWPAQMYPHDTAFQCNELSLTFSVFNTRVNKLAHGLLSLGLNKGDHCALMMNNRTEFFESWFAILKAGLVVVRLNARDDMHTHRHILRHSESSAIIISDNFQSEMSTIKNTIPHLKYCIAINANTGEFVDYEGLLSNQSFNEPNIEVDPDDLNCIRYTSGTTGKPKGVAMTHRAAEAGLHNFFMNLDRLITPDDIMLNVAPLSHAARLLAFPYYYRGAKNIILERFQVRKVLETIQKERVSVIFLIPTMINRILDDVDLTDYDVSSLKRIFYGTSPINPKRLKRAIDYFGPIFRQNYGMAEANMPLISLLPSQHINDRDDECFDRLSSVGRPALNVEVKIVDEKMNEVQRGQVGEIAIRSGSAMEGYWKNKKATNEILRKGWLLTGDLARMDSEGYIFIVDRKKDVIISGGFNIYPKEIEAVISAHPAIKEVAVIGVPDEQWGEAVKAFIVPQDDQTVQLEEIIEICKTKLAGYKKPKFIKIVERFEKNATGKIIKKNLQDIEWKGHKRRVY